MSKVMLKTFSNMPDSSKICISCVKLYHKKKLQENKLQSDPYIATSESNFDASISQSESDAESSPTKKVCLSRVDELEDLLDGLKEKFRSLPPNDPLRVSILTIAPDSWSSRKIATEFDTSRRMAAKAKELKKQQGIRSMPISKVGKTLSTETVNKVIQFYELDINSRIMPNKKDCVTVKKDGEKQKVQKRLLMYDVCVLHTKFKELYPEYPLGLIC